MKKRRTHLLAAIVFGMLTVVACATATELERCQKMTRFLHENGIREFASKIREPEWQVPEILSAWHVVSVANAERRVELEAARKLGSQVLTALDSLAAEVHGTSEEEKLRALVGTCLSVSEWAFGQAGYGNVLLAHRALDLAAVGLAKILVNHDGSFERCSNLLERLREPWIESSNRAQSLNLEAGEKLFEANSLQDVWGAGRILRRQEKNPELIRDLGPIAQHVRRWDSAVMRKHAAFFDEDDLINLGALTARRVWEIKWHQRLVEGFGLQSVKYVRALSAFLKAVGHFPTKLEEEVLTDAEKRSVEIEKADLAERGIKLSKHESFFPSPQAAAFNQAWKRYLRKTDSSGSESSYNLDAEAWQAFDRVKRGEFVDEDETLKRHTSDRVP